MLFRSQTSLLQDQVLACTRHRKDLAGRVLIRLSFTGVDLGVHVALRTWHQTAHHAISHEKLSLLAHASNSWQQSTSNAELERDLQDQLAALAGNKQRLLQGLEARWSRDTALCLLQDVVRWWSAAAMRQSSDRTSSRERGERVLLTTVAAKRHELLRSVVGRVLDTSEIGSILAFSLQGWLSATLEQKRGRDHESAVAALSGKLVVVNAQVAELEAWSVSKLKSQRIDVQRVLLRE